MVRDVYRRVVFFTRTCNLGLASHGHVLSRQLLRRQRRSNMVDFIAYPEISYLYDEFMMVRPELLLFNLVVAADWWEGRQTASKGRLGVIQ